MFPCVSTLKDRLERKEKEDIRSYFHITCIFTIRIIIAREYGLFHVYRDAPILII